MNKTPEQLRVKILEDGIHCKEANSLEKPIRFLPKIPRGNDEEMNKWNEAESKLRTFTIIEANGKAYPFRPYDGSQDVYYFEQNSIHTAELLPNGKIKIID